MYSDDYSLQKQAERQAEIDAANGLRPLPVHPDEAEPVAGRYHRAPLDDDTAAGYGLMIVLIIAFGFFLLLVTS